MHYSFSVVLAFVASSALALPALLEPRQSTETSGSDQQSHDEASTWDAGATRDFRIHESCNTTEVTQLRKGFADTMTLATHAKQHILRFSNSSQFYQKYFGEAPTGEAIGYYEKLINGDRGNALFRCDNPDGNCKNKGWGGHWRGENATGETVICPLSYETRRPLEQLCAFGYTVAGSETNTYFGSDLIHRLFHMPAFGDDHVEHFAEDYAGALELARTNSSFATHDSDILQYFALDTYAHDIAVPGVGCSGKASTSMGPAQTSTTNENAVESTAEAALAQSTPAQVPATATPPANPPTPITAGTASTAAAVPSVSHVLKNM
ncbi:MAG: hypothetical protein Q9228_005246 [Teloschistes exilis]